MIFDLSYLPITQYMFSWNYCGQTSQRLVCKWQAFIHYKKCGRNTFSESCYKKDDDLENIVIENDEQV